MSFVCPNCQISFNYKCVLKKHLLKKKSCKPCNIPVITDQEIPVIQTTPVVGININISFSGSSLEVIHSQMIEYLNNLKIININMSFPVVPVETIVKEEVPVVPVEIIVKEEVPVVTVETIVKEENDLEDKINLEIEKDKILKIMEKEFKDELKKNYKITVDKLRVEQLKNLKKRNDENIQKIKDAVKIPDQIPTLIVIKKNIVINNVEQTLEYATKLNNELNNNYKKIERLGESEEMTKEMKNILKENIKKTEELNSIKKALKVKKIVLDLPHFKVQEIKSNIVPEIDYISICSIKKTLTPYQVSQVMNYTSNIVNSNLSMKQRILQYIPKGATMDHLIEIARNMED